MSRIWAGIDVGKGHHHGLALDADGKTLLSRRVANDEPELLKLVGLVVVEERPEEVAADVGTVVDGLVDYGEVLMEVGERSSRRGTVERGRGASEGVSARRRRRDHSAAVHRVPEVAPRR